MLKIKKRPLDVHDMIRLKKIEPYATERQNAKQPNFGSMFGSKPGMLNTLLVNGGYTENTFDTVIKAVGLEAEVEKMTAKHSAFGRSEFDIKGLTVATFLRKQFFKMYSGLIERIQREVIFSMEHGYVQHYHGIKRMIPEMKLLNWGPWGEEIPEIQGIDKIFYAMVANNLINVCANSNIQGSEPPHAFMLGAWCMWTIKEWQTLYPDFNETYIFNNVHDSLDFYCHVDHKEILIPLIRYCLEFPVAPGTEFGVELPIDIEEANMSKDHQMYKHGKGVDLDSFLPLEEAIEEWYKKTGVKLPMPTIPCHKDGTPFTGFTQEPRPKPLKRRRLKL